MDERYSSDPKTVIDAILHREYWLDWLLNLGIKAEKIADFGCNIGSETLALMCYFDANEAIGLDKDENAIMQAQNSFEMLKSSIQTIGRNMMYYSHNVSTAEREWWRSVPNFFKQKIFNADFRLDYIVQDITIYSALPSNHFDLAFCDFALHHIWYNDGKLDRERTVSAIQEMARVVRSGGVVAAFELIQYEDKPRLDFQDLFQEVGLRSVHVNEPEREGHRGRLVVGEYCYRKQ